MARMRLFELARELGIKTPDLVHLAQRNGLAIHSAARQLTASEVTELRGLVNADRASRATPPPAIPAGPRIENEETLSDGVGTCTCCRRPGARLYRKHLGSGEWLTTEHCMDCHDHRGNLTGDLARRDTDHLRLWAAERATLVREGQVRAEAYERQIAQLRAELEARPVREVPVGREEIQQISDVRDSALRSRDAAFQALSLIRLQHRDAGDGNCRCGTRLTRCATFAEVDRYPALDSWERAQFERLQRGMPCSLPSGHAGRLDHRWRPAGWDAEDEEVDLDSLAELERVQRDR